MKLISAVLRIWLPVALVNVALSALVYLVGQQSLRLNANDPQVQMAEDAARAIEAGQQPADALPAGKVDIAASLSPYWVYYGSDGAPSAGSGLLDGALPRLPDGVLSSAGQSGENRVTWQPRAGVRSAVVVAAVKGGAGGYVLAGRSLREVENRVDKLTLLTALGLAATLAASLVLGFVLEFLHQKVVS